MSNYLSLNKAPDILLKIIKASILIVLFLPLVMNSSYFFPFIVFKNVLFRIFVEVALVAYLVLAHLRPEYRPNLNFRSMNKVTLAIIVFFLISIVSGVLGIGVYRSFWSNYERMAGIFHLFHLVAFFVVLVNVFKNEKDWHSFFTFSIFTSLIMSFLAFAQYLQIPFLLQSSGGTRLTSTVGNATFLAAYLIFSLFFTVYFFIKKNQLDIKLLALSFAVLDGYLVVSSILNQVSAGADWGLLNFLKFPFLTMSLEFPRLWIPFAVFQILVFGVWFYRRNPYATRGLLAVIFIFNFFIFFSTQTRGAIIGLAASIGFLALASLFLRVDQRVKIVSAIFLVGIVLAPIGIIAGKDTSFVKSNNTLRRLSTISLTDTTTESRLLTWQASWQGWRETPKSFLIGYGPENYYYAFNKYFPEEIYKDEGSRVWFDRAHNIIFDVGVTTGILGLLAYLSIMVFAAYYMLKRYKQGASISLSIFWIALLVAYFIQNFFVFDTINTEIPFYLSLAFMVFLTYRQNDSEETGQAEENEIQRTGAPNAIYLATLAVVLFFGVFIINAKTLQANKYLVEAVTSQEITPGSPDSKDALFEKAIDSAIVGRFEAREQLADFVNGFSKDQSVGRQLRASLVEKAETELKKNISEEPKNVRHHLYLSNFYNSTTEFDDSNPEKVIELITEKGIPLSPTRPQLYYEVGQAYAFLRDFEQAFEYFKRGSDLVPWVIEDRWNLITLAAIFQEYEVADREFERLRQDFDFEKELARINEDLKGQLILDGLKKLSNVYIQTENFSKAVEVFQLIIDVQPTAANYADFALMYAKIGENQKSREALEKAIELDPELEAQKDDFLRKLETGELLST